MEAVELGGDANAAKRLTVLRAIDKLDRLGVGGVEKLLGRGREDESGDFTKGAGLNDTQINRIINFTGWGERGSGAKSTLSANEVTIANFETAVEGSALGEKGIAELAEIKNFVAAAGYDDGRIVIDPSVVRGLEYYTGAVFEVELAFETKDEKGRPVRFGSVGGGGRYDGLVSRFRGEPVPATGFSVGVSRLLAALKAIKSPIVTSDAQQGPVLVTVFDQSRIRDYQKMTQTLRNAGIRAEMYLGSKNHNLGQQLKYADKRHSPCAIIQGSDEKARGELQIKDLAIGTQLAGEAKEREEYLQKQAQAQFAVKEDRLVEAVRELLAKHGGRQP